MRVSSDSMDDQTLHAVVRILGRGGEVVGSGFFVAEGVVVTCAHVVQAAGCRPGEAVRLACHGGRELRAVLPADGYHAAEDVAFLRVDGDAPAPCTPCRLAQGQRGAVVRAFGYPDVGRVGGLWGEGTLIEMVSEAGAGRRLWQLRSDAITAGFSGGPVWDEAGRVVGMVTAVTRPDALGRLRSVAFAIPAETLRRLSPVELTVGEPAPPPQSSGGASYYIRIEHASHFAIGDGASVHGPDVPPPTAPPAAGQPGPLPRNPFTDRGRINDPARLFDRRGILRELRNMLAVGNAVSLVGEPEIGKSSLLYALYRTADEWLPGGRVLYVDLQGVLDVEDFCIEVLEGMGREPGDLRSLKRALRRERVVLLLDEVEKLTRPAFSGELHDLLRALAQEETLTLAVAGHRPLTAIFPPSSDTSSFHNIFNLKRLGPFTPDDARAFIHHRLRGTGVTFAPWEVERLVFESGGHPARLQRLAYELFEMRHPGG